MPLEDTYDVVNRLRSVSPSRLEGDSYRIVQHIRATASWNTAMAPAFNAARMAQVLGIGQDSVSRLEQRSDLLISTLRGYVAALGGRLSLVAEFPNQEPVILSGIAALDGDTV